MKEQMNDTLNPQISTPNWEIYERNALFTVSFDGASAFISLLSSAKFKTRIFGNKEFTHILNDDSAHEFSDCFNDEFFYGELLRIHCHKLDKFFQENEDKSRKVLKIKCNWFFCALVFEHNTYHFGSVLISFRWCSRIVGTCDQC